MATQLATLTGSTSDPYPPDAEPRVFGFSDGYAMAVWGDRTGGPSGLILVRAAIKAPGSSWGTATTVYDGTSSGLVFFGDFSAGGAQNGDTVYLFVQTNTLGGFAVLTVPWLASSHTLGTVSTITGTVPKPDPSTSEIVLNDLVNDPTTGGWLVGGGHTYTDPGGAGAIPRPGIWTTAANFTGWAFSPAANFQLSLPVGGRMVRDRAGTTYYIYRASSGPGTVLTLVKFAVLGGWQTSLYDELVFSGTFANNPSAANDAAGKLDIFWREGGSIITRKRTGDSTYGTASTIASNAVGGPAVTVDSSTGDVVVFYASTASQANGEIWTVKRSGTTWGTPALFVGGDTAGYGAPAAGEANVGGYLHVLFRKGISSYSIWTDAVLRGSAPSTPSAPTVSAGTTPTFGETYANPIPTDLKDADEIQVERTSDSHQMLDSGAMSGTTLARTYGVGSNTGDPNYHAPETLVIGTQYRARYRVRDQVVQIWSGWSAWTTWTPYSAPVATIYSITDNAVEDTSSPTTISGGIITVKVTVSQPETHGLDQLRLVATRGDTGAVAADVTSTISAASGAAVSTGLDLTGPPTGVTLSLVAYTRDVVSGLWSDASTAWSILTAWVPPDPINTVRVRTERDTGARVILTYTIPATATRLTIERRRHDASPYDPEGQWTQIYPRSGDAGDDERLTDFLPPATPYDYRLTSYSARNVAGPPITVNAVEVDMPTSGLGTIIMDPTDPDLFVEFGMAQSLDRMIGREFIEEVNTYIPHGATDYISSFTKADAWRASRTFSIEPVDWSTGTQRFQVLAKLHKLRTRHGPHLVRDASGVYGFATLTAVSEVGTDIGPDGVWTDVSFTLQSERWTAGPVVIPG